MHANFIKILNKLYKITPESCIGVLFFLWLPVLVIAPRYGVVIFGLVAGFSMWAFWQQHGPFTTQSVLRLLFSYYKHYKATSIWQRRLSFLFWLGLGVEEFLSPTTPIPNRLFLLLLGYGVWNLVPKETLYQERLKGGGLVSMAMITLEWLMGHPFLNLIHRGPASHYAIIALTFSMVIWPLAVYLPRRYLYIAVGVLIIISRTLCDCDTAVLALITGVIGFSLATKATSRFFYRGMQWVLFMTTLTLPFLCYYGLTPTVIDTFAAKIPHYSSIHRLHIYKAASERIMEKPYKGWGLDQSFEKDDMVYTDHKQQQQTLPRLIVHPHNMILQWWLEWGVLGALFWGAVLMFIVERLRQLPDAKRPAAFGFFISNLCIMGFSIGFWQTWWWASLLLLWPYLYPSPIIFHNSHTKPPCLP